MKSKPENRHRRFRNRLIAALFSLGTITSILPAWAVVPSVYVPTADELKGSSIGIGRTAAQLLQMGQAKEAAQLAALEIAHSAPRFKDTAFAAVTRHRSIHARRRTRRLLSTSRMVMSS